MEALPNTDPDLNLVAANLPMTSAIPDSLDNCSKFAEYVATEMKETTRLDLCILLGLVASSSVAPPDPTRVPLRVRSMTCKAACHLGGAMTLMDCMG